MACTILYLDRWRPTRASVREGSSTKGKEKKKKEKKEKKVIFLLLSLHLDPCYSRVRSEIEMGGKRIFSFSLDRLPSLRAMAPVH